MADSSLLVDPDRFRPIGDPRTDFPGLGFTGADSFALDGDGLLITDPIFLADVYNANDDPVAAYLRANGITRQTTPPHTPEHNGVAERANPGIALAQIGFQPLAVGKTGIAADEAAVALADREYTPDVEVMGDYDGFWQGTDRPLQWQVGARVNVPIRTGRRAGGVAEAQARVAQRRAEMARLMDRIGLEVQEEYERLQEQEKVIALYEKTLLPAATANIKEARTGYVTGKVPFLNLREAQQGLTDLAKLPGTVRILLARGVGRGQLLLARGLSRRIRELERRTRLIAAGDFSPMPLPTRDDELRDLARSVNDMAERLAQLQEAARKTERLRLLGQVSGGLAHQLRNGVTGARLAVQPRPYQREAIRHWLDAEGRGVVVLPTGAGKTVVAMMAMEAVGARTLVGLDTRAEQRSQIPVAHRHDHVLQNCHALEDARHLKRACYPQVHDLVR